MAAPGWRSREHIQGVILVDANGDPTSLAITTGDLEIGAVEIKNSSTDDRASVIATAPANTDLGLVVRSLRSATATATITSVNDAATSTALLAANAARKGAYFFNDSTSILYLAYHATAASTTAYTVQIAANGYWEMPTHPIYTGAIWGIWSADASGAVRITEL